MKKTLTYTILIFLIISCKTKVIDQNSTSIVQKVENKRVFKNQGEQENYWAEKLFEEKYVKQNYEKFNGKIEILNNTTIKYDEKTLEIWNTEEELKLIFEKGIFYPNIITGNQQSEPLKTKEELNKLTQNERIFYNMTRTDSLRISSVKELNFINKPPKIKRFKFLYYRKSSMNPQLYYFELTNDKATEKTSNKNFIENSKVTFCKSGSILI